MKIGSRSSGVHVWHVTLLLKRLTMGKSHANQPPPTWSISQTLLVCARLSDFRDFSTFSQTRNKMCFITFVLYDVLLDIVRIYFRIFFIMLVHVLWWIFTLKR